MINSKNDVTNNLIRIIDDAIGGLAGQIKFISTKNDNSITISNLETPVFSIDYSQKSKYGVIFHTSINGTASSNQTLTFNLYADGTLLATFKDTRPAGYNVIYLNYLVSSNKSGSHKLELKALADMGTFTIDIGKSEVILKISR